MDTQLALIIQRLNDQNGILDIIRTKYLEAESCRKHYEARMVAMAQGKSHAEKLVNAQATESWRNQSISIARFESAYEFEKLKYQILDKEFLAIHLSLKLNDQTIRRG